MKAYERFLKYVSVWTTSDANSETVPSADRELVLAKLLVEEMKELGIVDRERPRMQISFRMLRQSAGEQMVQD